MNGISKFSPKEPSWFDIFHRGLPREKYHAGANLKSQIDNELLGNRHSGEDGQAMVETLFTIVVITSMFFAAMQVAILSIAWIRANEAAQAGLRCAITCNGSTAEGAEGQNPSVLAQTAVTYILGFGLPAKTVVWDKYPMESAGYDHSSGPQTNGAQIRMFSVHVYYFEKLMFSSLLKPISTIGFLNVSDKYGGGAAHCRMIKPPDWRYYGKAYPEAYKFNE